MKIAFIFTGQGSQQINMGNDFYQNDLESKNLYDEFPDIRDCCFNGEELDNTRYTQACLFLTNYIIGKKIKMKPDYVLGLSLGEYNALCYANSFDYKTGVELVRQRGAIMADSLNDDSCMYAIIKNNDKIQDILNQVDGVCEISNYNSYNQTIISGEIKAINQAVIKLKELKSRCIPLKVSGAFHTSLLNDASLKLNKVLLNSDINQPTMPIVYNYSGSCESEGVIENLTKQICNPVKFLQSLEYLQQQGVDTIIEIGVGNVISKLVKQTLKDIKVYNCGTVNDLKELENLINE
jgi:[acyl-carrier-protein] S-malonyltransferase